MKIVNFKMLDTQGLRAEFIQIDINIDIVRFKGVYRRAVKLRTATVSFVMAVGRHGTNFLLLNEF